MIIINFLRFIKHNNENTNKSENGDLLASASSRYPDLGNYHMSWITHSHSYFPTVSHFWKHTKREFVDILDIL